MKGVFFGKLDTGATVYRYLLKNEVAEAAIITYGAAIQALTVFGKDVIGGYDDLDSYITDDSHQGAIIGRVANRVGGAKFQMDGKTYHLPKNDGENCLHGGDGFDRKIWDVVSYSENEIKLHLFSSDGEEGFPNALDVFVTYVLSEAELKIKYLACPHGKTPIALTNHAYFNLDGLGGDVLAHEVEIFADRYTEVDGRLIPNGIRPEVFGTIFDFTTPHSVGERIGGDFIGYDHNYILSPKKYETVDGVKLALAARVRAGELMMEMYTDQPGVQLYIGNFLGGKPDFKGGIKRIRHGALCLEAQTEPNCINHGIGFYDKGEEYRQTTIYRFRKV